jgi:hypothetical protein
MFPAEPDLDSVKHAGYEALSGRLVLIIPVKKLMFG